MGLTHLGCPSCGGTLSLAEGQRIVSCGYCGRENLVLIPGAVPRSVVSLRVSREAARELAQQFLRKPALPRALRERGRIQDVSLYYVPFYEFTATRLGTILLRDTRKVPAPLPETERDGRALERWLLEPPTTREQTRVIQQEFARIRPACDLPEVGAGRIRLEEMRRGPSPVALEAYDLVELQSRAVPFAPTKEPGRFAEEVQRRIKVRGDRTGVVEERLKLLYYPVWQARYRHAGRSYAIAVDGVTGSILAARSPLEFRRAAAVSAMGLALAALSFGRPARELARTALAVGDTPGILLGMVGAFLGMALGGALALFIAWVGWTTLRRGGEVTLDGPVAEPVPAIGHAPGGIAGIRARMTEWLLGIPRGSPGRST